jgi:hypothetical protein
MRSEPEPSAGRLPLALRPDTLLGIGSRLAPPGLLSAAAAEQLARIPKSLPPVGCVGAFEVRLEDESAPVDFEVCLRNTPALRAQLRSWLASPDADGFETRSEAWARAIRFLAAWSDPASGLCRAVPVAWLEFDAPVGGAEPEPFVVLTLDRDCFHPGGVGDRPLLADFLATTFRLIGGGLDPEVEATLRRCTAALPRNAEFAHAAVRPAPGGDIARLVVRLEGRTLPEQLAALGWEGSREELRGLLDALFTTRAFHPVNLDFGSRVGARVGIEFHHPTSPVADGRWRGFLDRLSAARACTRAQRRRIETWPLPTSREPRLARVSRDLLVKVVYQSGAPLRAKAYLPFAVEAPAVLAFDAPRGAALSSPA